MHWGKGVAARHENRLRCVSHTPNKPCLAHALGKRETGSAVLSCLSSQPHAMLMSDICKVFGQPCLGCRLGQDGEARMFGAWPGD